MVRLRQSALAVGTATAALVAPSVVLAVAWATWFVACLDSATTEACGRNDLAIAQLVLACVGFVPLLILVRAVWVGRARTAWLAGGATLVVYAAWALLNDAATHGWNDLILLPG